MSILKIDSIITRLNGHQRDLEDVGDGTREAAVAAILRPGDHTEALFILRASREGDPWSGQMAFPGGHKDPEDIVYPSYGRKGNLGRNWTRSVKTRSAFGGVRSDQGPPAWAKYRYGGHAGALCT